MNLLPNPFMEINKKLKPVRRKATAKKKKKFIYNEKKMFPFATSKRTLTD